MTIQSYVNNILQVPVTRLGNKYIVEAVEIVLDFGEQSFYPTLCEATGKTTRQIEKSIRDAKELSLRYMDEEIKNDIFPQAESYSMSNTRFILLAAQYYKENYENESEG